MKIIRVLSAYIRFIFHKLYYLKSLRGSWIGLMFWNAKILIESNGDLKLGKKIILSDYSELKAIGSLVIGSKVFVNKYSRIISLDNIQIGSNVLIAQFVTILDHDHNRIMHHGNMIFENYNTGPVYIGDNVLIGDKVTILKGSHIGNNVVIGANCVINGLIPSNSIVSFKKDSQIILKNKIEDAKI
ncbi:MAG: acyltransferase [Saprospiraceae bacterium]|nr:acyltransferase [Saprospiraceae bacterium]MBK7737490.1 acyltransferase [Saprospiraceae bacterium]MBK7913930.1 acyltransferase [Saprospiraceae bacterium]